MGSTCASCSKLRQQLCIKVMYNTSSQCNRRGNRREKPSLFQVHLQNVQHPRRQNCEVTYIYYMLRETIDHMYAILCMLYSTFCFTIWRKVGDIRGPCNEVKLSSKNTHTSTVSAPAHVAHPPLGWTGRAATPSSTFLCLNTGLSPFALFARLVYNRTRRLWHIMHTQRVAYNSTSRKRVL